jgi:hypothetical protein
MNAKHREHSICLLSGLLFLYLACMLLIDLKIAAAHREKAVVLQQPQSPFLDFAGPKTRNASRDLLVLHSLWRT